MFLQKRGEVFIQKCYLASAFGVGSGTQFQSPPDRNYSCYWLFFGHHVQENIDREKFKRQLEKKRNLLVLTPIFGSVLFIVLYFVATLFYPGGSQVDPDSIGFSWTDNYWCNLLNDYAINGQPNPAKPIAVAGMCVLCLTLSFFWLLFPNHVNIRKPIGLLIQISAILAMTIALFLFTTIDHDLITNLASVFGLIATTGTFIGLFKAKWYGLFAFGLLNILLVGLNNYVYYNKGLIFYLPIIQKISFMSFLVWVCSIDIKIYRVTLTTIKPRQNNR